MVLDPGISKSALDGRCGQETFRVVCEVAGNHRDDPYLFATLAYQLAHFARADLGEFLGAGVDEICKLPQHFQPRLDWSL
jgi:hypothetical protein